MCFASPNNTTLLLKPIMSANNQNQPLPAIFPGQQVGDNTQMSTTNQHNMLNNVPRGMVVNGPAHQMVPQPYENIYNGVLAEQRNLDNNRGAVNNVGAVGAGAEGESSYQNINIDRPFNLDEILADNCIRPQYEARKEKLDECYTMNIDDAASFDTIFSMYEHFILGDKEKVEVFLIAYIQKYEELCSSTMIQLMGLIIYELIRGNNPLYSLKTPTKNLQNNGIILKKLEGLRKRKPNTIKDETPKKKVRRNVMHPIFLCDEFVKIYDKYRNLFIMGSFFKDVVPLEYAAIVANYEHTMIKINTKSFGDIDRLGMKVKFDRMIFFMSDASVIAPKNYIMFCTLNDDLIQHIIGKFTDLQFMSNLRVSPINECVVSDLYTNDCVKATDILKKNPEARNQLSTTTYVDYVLSAKHNKIIGKFYARVMYYMVDYKFTSSYQKDELFNFASAYQDISEVSPPEDDLYDICKKTKDYENIVKFLNITL